MRLYLSGGMTGYPDHNFPRFNEVTELLEDIGYDVENPASKGEIPGWAWENYMRYDVWSIVGSYETGRRVGGVDGIATLENWRKSRGARMEVGLAKKLGLPIKPYKVWLRDATLEAFRKSELIGV